MSILRNPIVMILAVIAIFFVTVRQRGAARERARVVAVHDSVEREARRAAVEDRRRYDSIMAQRGGPAEMAASIRQMDSSLAVEERHRAECLKLQAPIIGRAWNEDRTIGYGDTAVACRK